MALKQLLLASCLISLSLVTSSSYDYAPKPKPNEYEYVPRPNLEKQKPKPNESEYVPQKPNPNEYRYAPQKPKLKPNEYKYVPQKPKPKPKPNEYKYIPLPNLEKQKPKPNEYVPQPNLEKQNSKPNEYEYVPRPNLEKQKPEEFFTKIGVQGVVYCKSGSKLTPLQGAVVRVTCLTTDENGYESAPFSLLSGVTDVNGYFLATFGISELQGMGKRSECKAFLDASPVEACDLPTDANKGMSGAPLGPHSLLTHKKMKLYSVGPFVYTTQPQPHYVGNGY